MSCQIHNSLIKSQKLSPGFTGPVSQLDPLPFISPVWEAWSAGLKSWESPVIYGLLQAWLPLTSLMIEPKVTKSGYSNPITYSLNSVLLILGI